MTSKFPSYRVNNFPFFSFETRAFESFAISQASAELLDIIGKLNFSSAIGIILAHFNEVQETKIASR
jgi:hypothetical protein